MHIVIDSIDRDSSALRGFTPTPSFKVRFGSNTFGGTARLVPASGFADAKTEDEFDVELAQESVTGFRVSEVSGNLGVEPLLPLGDFKVRGTVRHVSFPSEPVGNRITAVQVGDAEGIYGLKREQQLSLSFMTCQCGMRRSDRSKVRKGAIAVNDGQASAHRVRAIFHLHRPLSRGQ